MDEKNDILKRIQRGKENNIPLFSGDPLGKIHKKVVNKVQRIEENKKARKMEVNVPDNVQTVIQADMAVREYVKNLVVALSVLNDRDIAKKLLSEHLEMLSSVMKEFN